MRRGLGRKVEGVRFSLIIRSLIWYRYFLGWISTSTLSILGLASASLAQVTPTVTLPDLDAASHPLTIQSTVPSSQADNVPISPESPTGDRTTNQSAGQTDLLIGVYLTHLKSTIYLRREIKETLFISLE